MCQGKFLQKTPSVYNKYVFICILIPNGRIRILAVFALTHHAPLPILHRTPNRILWQDRWLRKNPQRAFLCHSRGGGNPVSL